MSHDVQLCQVSFYYQLYSNSKHGWLQRISSAKFPFRVYYDSESD